MVLSPRLDLRQSQSLVMTPQLQQAIKLLQLNNLELSAYVEQEMTQNPLLEREDGVLADDDRGDNHRDGSHEGGDFSSSGQDFDGALGGEGPRPADDGGSASGGGEDDHGAVRDLNLDEGAAGEHTRSEGALDVDYDNTWNSAEDGGEKAAAPQTEGHSTSGDRDDWGARSNGGAGGGGAGQYGGELPSLEQTLAGEVSLRDYLMSQVRLMVSTPGDEIIAVSLIDSLDEIGYMRGDLADIAERLGVSVDAVEAVLTVMQGIDPAGLFARDLGECLALQLIDKDRFDPAMKTLLGNLDLLARRDYARLRKICGVDGDDLGEMINELQALDPKPGRRFDHSITQAIVPDVFMRAGADGQWIIELNGDTLPRVLINNSYYAEVSRAVAKGKNKGEEKRYINECYQSASWLVKALHQRATTIMKVASEIVRMQDGFFVHGVSALRPLVLRDVADAIGMHESTVSRVTSNKYIATPRGIFELKYFFTSAISSADGGDAYSAEAVKSRIKSLVDGEPAHKILSDDKIVDLLKDEGMDIARRTVAKYRDALGIPSSVTRRREKRQQS
ncbi:RNA polymerase factor sigma-54 [Varunaivibrio sulfuroxidans]|uniref:RNA polymerase sigma-54 factor n=1 Tax=Varunaivibrio sulfuroxidans TaxID=1773489 RepID=A0A4R3JFU4_9PROT|nr:RNA polymerase factor sigma-54 [Varunaivibrio sulfuroxidans]TCS64742.1 RNA polymerase RpoN-/SigL-like sigma 54 subunit [Varunaivibrio sulfuroxidans]WES29953.1 RNA polymerase factor sigma-54 [Varunaivibrio sulfuroxidans]